MTDWLNLTAGVRETHFRGLVTENATDPRFGATVLLPRLDWVLSAFWGKYYQAPPLVTLSGPFVTRTRSPRVKLDTDSKLRITLSGPFAMN